MIDQTTFKETKSHITKLFQEHHTVTSQIHELRKQLLWADKSQQILSLEQRINQQKFEIQQKSLLLLITGLLVLSLWGLAALLFAQKIIVANMGLVLFLAIMIWWIGYISYRIWHQIVSVKNLSQDLTQSIITSYERKTEEIIDDEPIIISTQPKSEIKRIVPKRKR